MTTISSTAPPGAAGAATAAGAADAAACTPADRLAKAELDTQVHELEQKISTRSRELRTATIGASTTPDWMGLGGAAIGAALAGFGGYKLFGVEGMLVGGLVGAALLGAGGRMVGIKVAAKNAGVDAVIDRDAQVGTWRTQLAEKRDAFTLLDARC
jgi:hypothetical protein